jgi:hypothetical protein
MNYDGVFLYLQCDGVSILTGGVPINGAPCMGEKR